LTQEGLAEVLLRILGVYLVACGIIGLAGAAGQLSFLSDGTGPVGGLPNLPWRFFGSLLCAPVAELIVGAYFFSGGQWIYKKVLTPIFRSFHEDVPQETREDGSDDRQGKDNN
jgi:hypothetical protein